MPLLIKSRHVATRECLITSRTFSCDGSGHWTEHKCHPSASEDSPSGAHFEHVILPPTTRTAPWLRGPEQVPHLRHAEWNVPVLVMRAESLITSAVNHHVREREMFYDSQHWVHFVTPAVKEELLADRSITRRSLMSLLTWRGFACGTDGKIIANLEGSRDLDLASLTNKAGRMPALA